MREKILRGLARWHIEHPGRMLLFVVILTIIFGVFASQLKMTMRWSDLLPSHDPRTLEFNKIVDEFKTATNMIVVVQGEEQDIKRFADELAPKLRDAKDPEHENRAVVQRVDYKAEIEFLSNRGLMLIKKDDLVNLKDVFTNPNLPELLTNLNDSMEKEYVGQSESISTREKEDQAVVFLDSIKDLFSLLHRISNGEPADKKDFQSVADKLLLGEPYFLSYDKKALILIGIPNFSMVDLEMCMSGTVIVQELVDEQLKAYPNVEAGLTGFIPLAHDEMHYSEQSLGYTSLIAIVAIFFMLVFSFRMWSAPLLAMLNLLIGVLWAVGTASILVGQLNIMTSMMAVILLGLGIDFSIHIISGFTERRSAGDSLLSSLESTFLKSGKGVLTGGITTACAFLTLSISSSRGMKEMGLVTGFGLLATLLTTFLFLPILLVYREKRMEKRAIKSGQTQVRKNTTFRFLGKTSLWLGHHYIFTLISGVLLTALFVWSATRITFDQNYMNIEPKGIPSITLQDTIQEKFDLSMDYALVLTDSIEKSREISKEYRKMATVASSEDISLYLPSPAEQQERIPYINDIKNMMEQSQIRESISEAEIPVIIQQLDRLRMNIMEIQDMAFLGGQDKVDMKCKEIVGDPNIENQDTITNRLITLLNEEISAQGLGSMQREFAPYFKSKALQMASTEPITLDDLPVSVLDRYGNTDRSEFMVTVIPAGSVWQDASFLKRFVEDLDHVSDRATGMPPVFRSLLEIIGKDGRNAAILTLILVFVLLWIDFRKPHYALMAMIPLAVGAFWMVGLMKLTGMQFTVMNVMALPLIIGIGIDDGVHIVHRWIAEGKGRIYTVFASTGKAILLTSLTTMLAFGSLVFSIWRGFAHLGGALFLGVGTCFLTTVLFLSGIIGAIERKTKQSDQI
ncbi:RND family transporter [Acidobacteriota bacterium]